MESSILVYTTFTTFIHFFSYVVVLFVIKKLTEFNYTPLNSIFFKIYFIAALTVTLFKTTVIDIYHITVPWSLLIVGFFAVSMVLLAALTVRVRKKSVLYASIIGSLSYLVSDIFIDYRFSTHVLIHSFIAIALYSYAFYIAMKHAKSDKNIGYYIYAFAFSFPVIFAFFELFFVFEGKEKIAYLITSFAIDTGLLFVIFGFLVTTMMHKYENLTKLSITDPLTGMNIYLLLDSKVPSFNRTNECFSVVTIDLDYFKKINDTYGHEAGDTVLKKITSLIKLTHRNTDISARLGGEEFILVLPNTHRKTALIIAEKLRMSISSLTISYKEHKINVTASFGVDTSCGDINIDNLSLNADKALYQSKHLGRNRITHYEELVK